MQRSVSEAEAAGSVWGFFPFFFLKLGRIVCRCSRKRDSLERKLKRNGVSGREVEVRRGAVVLGCVFFFFFVFLSMSRGLRVREGGRGDWVEEVAKQTSTHLYPSRHSRSLVK
ncbi:MAG: hypothetical protein ACKERG_01115 [Candidatus Hodgkinia cicadicola]